MVLSVTMRFMLLLCIGFLVIQPDKVSGLRSITLALRGDKELLEYVQNSRILTAVAMDSLDTRQGLAPAPSLVFDPSQSNKRQVRKGSDPIHNRW
ncbi:hypothetical protein SLE2022_290570 [Rubroshorea leprosula]|uniref:Uncharacterized protein n=1 Tax=Rubroshorea leprosula TaxID=152421 RepID=A0AAV5KTT6_9ROSI|nr:hypothetical protein SLEP1_g37109 [Rubroshorea leprosula]